MSTATNRTYATGKRKTAIARVWLSSGTGQVTVNECFALFFEEKRPFFLEGIELFATPNQLVYTRQIGNPIAGGKFTGKFGKFTAAYLAAVDDAPDGNAVFNLLERRRPHEFRANL